MAVSHFGRVEIQQVLEEYKICKFEVTEYGEKAT
jgi:hypothetical protein